jgi:N-acetyl-gamma-glutamyl-phosphate reductase
VRVGYRVSVAGASGYAGGELLRLIAGHPDLELGAAAGHGHAGQLIGSVHPQLRTYANLPFADTSPSALAEADLVFLALPHGMSGALVAHLPGHVAVVDLAADHRPDPAWAYGLPELPGARVAIRSSRRIANTGCYAVAVVLALAPLIVAGLAETEDVVVVAASGTSGAGRDAKAHLVGAEVMGDLSAYRVGGHQHVAEICQASGAHSLSMTPVLAPMPRGILATVTARPTQPMTTSDVHGALAAAYADEPFVHVLPEGEQPHTAATLGSNAVHLGAAVDGSSARIIVTSAIDNLGKGAAGQAVQNANLVLGLDETAGLTANGIAP